MRLYKHRADPLYRHALIVVLAMTLGMPGCYSGAPPPGPDEGPALPDAVDAVDVAEIPSDLDVPEPFVDVADIFPDDGTAITGEDLLPMDEGVDLEDTVEATDVAPEATDVSTEPETPPPALLQICFPLFDDPEAIGPEYDYLGPVIADHCHGTNHQDIDNVKKVVFLGDSVTVGTPNVEHLLSIDNQHFYRNLLAEWLTDHFNLSQGGAFGGWNLWKTYDYFSGKGGRMEAGDFKNCSKWGARTDDLLQGGGQIGECFPEGGSPEPTLFIFTMGGNDIAKITEEGGTASPEEVAAGYPKEWDHAYSTVDYLEEAIQYIKDPANFPGGAYVIYNNGYEFTDSTGQTDTCTPQYKLNIPGIGEIDLSELGIDMAGLAGMNPWKKPEVQAEIVIWMMEQYMRIAVDYQVDMIWTLESFCGHGYLATGPKADPENQCYLGPDSELWFDITCIHPSVAGHNAMYEMFKTVVVE